MKPKKVTFNLTQKDIDDGVSSSCTLCPTARSIGRRLRDGVYLSVGNATVTLTHQKRSYRWWAALPMEVCDFIRDFDDCMEVSPLSFTLSIPARYLK